MYMETNNRATLEKKNLIDNSNKKAVTTMLAVLVFIVLAIIIVLFVYFSYDLIKTLFEKGLRGAFS